MAVKSVQSPSSLFSVKDVRQFFLNVKEFPEVVFFGSMARQSWFVWLSASPLLLILMPLIAMALVAMAGIDIYLLVREKKKSLELWMAAVISTLCALLASISIGSLVLGTLMGFTFAAGPWIFLGSVLLFGASTFFNLGITLHEILKTQSTTPERMHFIQKAIHQVNMILTTTAVSGCVFFVILFPVSSVAATAFAIACVSLTGANIAWRYLKAWEKDKKIKTWLGLEKTLYECEGSDKDLLIISVQSNTYRETENPPNPSSVHLQKLFTNSGDGSQEVYDDSQEEDNDSPAADEFFCAPEAPYVLKL